MSRVLLDYRFSHPQTLLVALLRKETTYRYNRLQTPQARPTQIVMVTEDATATADGAKDFYGVAIQPKLRSDLATGHYAVFTNPKGTFRLISNEVSWSADRISNYGISFSCIEVI